MELEVIPPSETNITVEGCNITVIECVVGNTADYLFLKSEVLELRREVDKGHEWEEEGF